MAIIKIETSSQTKAGGHSEENHIYSVSEKTEAEIIERLDHQDAEGKPKIGATPRKIWFPRIKGLMKSGCPGNNTKCKHLKAGKCRKVFTDVSYRPGSKGKYMCGCYDR